MHLTVFILFLFVVALVLWMTAKNASQLARANSKNTVSQTVHNVPTRRSKRADSFDLQISDGGDEADIRPDPTFVPHGCTHLPDGYWADFHSHRVPFANHELIEKLARPVYSPHVATSFVYCRNNETVERGSCPAGAVYAGRGLCTKVDSISMSCLNRWWGFRMPEGDNKSYAECADAVEHEPGQYTFYTVKHCPTEKPFFDARLRACQSAMPKGTQSGNSRHIGIECLDDELAAKVMDGGNVVCADPRCIRDPQYFEIHYVKNTFTLDGMLRLPAMLKRCDADTLALVYDRKQELQYRPVKEYTFAVPGVYIETILPTHLYARVWDKEGGRWQVQTVHPESVKCVARVERIAVGKLRVKFDKYNRLLDFCRFSIHAHADTSNVICCKRICSRPAPLTAAELSEILAAATVEPYYTCSWLVKQILFKWHIVRAVFEPYWRFELAIVVYSDMYDRHERAAFKLFAFERWKSPEEETNNTEQVYFSSPINLLVYKWYDPSAVDDENHERYGGAGNLGRPMSPDRVATRVAADVMNFGFLPEDFMLSSALIRPTAFADGAQM